MPPTRFAANKTLCGVPRRLAVVAALILVLLVLAFLASDSTAGSGWTFQSVQQLACPASVQLKSHTTDFPVYRPMRMKERIHFHIRGEQPMDFGPGMDPDIHNTSVFFKEHYFNLLASRVGRNKNPYCQPSEAMPTTKYFASMRWEESDVKRETKEYLRKNVLVSIVTGHFDGYSRVKMSRCTWLGHFPQENLFIVTDSMRTPQDGVPIDDETRDLYRYGHWFATDDAPESGGNAGAADAVTVPTTAPPVSTLSPLSLVFFFGNVTSMTQNPVNEQRPAAWYTAQFRFFDSFNVMHRHVKSSVPARPKWTSRCSAPPLANYYRWVVVLDDDTNVQLDGLVNVMHYHNVYALYSGSGDLWWRLLAQEYVSSHANCREQTPMLWAAGSSSLLREDRRAWSAHCASLEARNRQQVGEFPWIPDFRADCEQLPQRMADVAKLYLNSHPDGWASVLARLVDGKDSLWLEVESLARLFSNALSFIGEEVARTHNSTLVVSATAEEKALFAEMWARSNALVDPAWVQLYQLPAERYPKDIRGGAGHLVTARAFYFHLMGREVAEAAERARRGTPAAGDSLSSLPPTIAYSYIKPCIMGAVLNDGLSSDIALTHCQPALRIASEEDFALSGLHLQGLLHSFPRPRNVEPQVPLGEMPYRCRSLLLPRRCLLPGETRWLLFTSATTMAWATGHFKMELAEPMMGRKTANSRRLGKKGLIARREQVHRLVYLRMKLYYEAVYYPAAADEEGGAFVGYTLPPGATISERAVAARLMERIGCTTEHMLPAMYRRTPKAMERGLALFKELESA